MHDTLKKHSRVLWKSRKPEQAHLLHTHTHTHSKVGQSRHVRILLRASSRSWNERENHSPVGWQEPANDFLMISCCNSYTIEIVEFNRFRYTSKPHACVCESAR